VVLGGVVGQLLKDLNHLGEYDLMYTYKNCNGGCEKDVDWREKCGGREATLHLEDKEN
jgi:hypothetical protein